MPTHFILTTRFGFSVFRWCRALAIWLVDSNWFSAFFFGFWFSNMQNRFFISDRSKLKVFDLLSKAITFELNCFVCCMLLLCLCVKEREKKREWPWNVHWGQWVLNSILFFHFSMPAWCWMLINIGVCTIVLSSLKVYIHIELESIEYIREYNTVNPNNNMILRWHSKSHLSLIQYLLTLNKATYVSTYQMEQGRRWTERILHEASFPQITFAPKHTKLSFIWAATFPRLPRDARHSSKCIDFDCIHFERTKQKRGRDSLQLI